MIEHTKRDERTHGASAKAHSQDTLFQASRGDSDMSVASSLSELPEVDREPLVTGSLKNGGRTPAERDAIIRGVSARVHGVLDCE